MFPKISQGKNQREKKAGPLIRCECGFEILLIPDLKSMVTAIDAHAAKHGKREKDIGKAVFEEERIRAILNARALHEAVNFMESRHLC